jgi:MATE family multidrug resistance protein
MSTMLDDSASVWRTTRNILRQSWPILISQWASISFGVLDTAMTGHASPVDLAATALAVAIYISVFVGLMGVMHALIPIQAQYYGGGKHEAVGRAFSQGIWVALLLSVCGGILMSFPDVWLSLSGNVDPAVRERLGQYLIVLTFGLPAALMFRTVYALANAVSRPKLFMMINLVGVAIKALLNWLLIFGNAGFPELGAVGAGLASVTVYWLSFCFGLWWVLRDPFYKRFDLKLRMPQFKQMWEILRLGIPMGASYMVEVSAFTFMALLIANEGTTITGAHQITANLAALCYMMPMAIGVASAALTAQAIGAQQYVLAHRTGMLGIGVTLTGALLTACVLFFGREHIVALYTDDLAVAAIALSLLAILPWFHVIDSMQCANIYLLRAHKIAMVPLILQTLSLTLVGLLGGWYFGFGPGQGQFEGVRQLLLTHSPPGAGTMWLMAGLGLGISATALHLWYRFIIYPRQLKKFKRL